MKNILILILLVTLGLYSCKESQADKTQMVSAQEMEKMIQLDNTQLVDVRTIEEFEDGHIEGAQNIVYDEDFASKISQLDKTQPVAVYCHTGGRSAKCAAILKEAGFLKIYDLDGGFEAWTYKDNLD